MERLYELHAKAKYDFIVIDTPPTRNALDFLEAPARMSDFFASRLLRWLIIPYRSRIVNLASRPFYQIADRILGSQFLEDIAEFFISFQSMYDGFIQRADAVSALLKSRATGFIIVTTLDPVSHRESLFFAEELEKRKMDLLAFVMNKVLGPQLRSKKAYQSAEYLLKNTEVIAGKVSESLNIDASILKRVLGEIATSFINYRSLAIKEAGLEDVTKKRIPHALKAPYLANEPVNVSELYNLANLLWINA
jgi:anion-transporting  ArsA/GET3 family ATPase